MKRTWKFDLSHRLLWAALVLALIGGLVTPATPSAAHPAYPMTLGVVQGQPRPPTPIGTCLSFLHLD